MHKFLWLVVDTFLHPVKIWIWIFIEISGGKMGCQWRADSTVIGPALLGQLTGTDAALLVCVYLKLDSQSHSGSV
jgi:hypothetical protein